MSCIICGRGACTESFHSTEEQEAYSDAIDAYEKFVEARERCRNAYQASEEEE